MEPTSQPTSKSIKLLQSAAIYYSTFAYGCAYTFLSPAVIALSRKFNTDVSNVSLVFTILTVTYLTSALLCGFLYNLVKSRSIMLIGVLTLMTIPLFAIPHVNDINAFFFLGAVLGAGCGGYDVGQVAGIIEIWRGEAAVYILTQHFAYSMGTILPSLILHPFLSGSVHVGDKEGHKEETNLVVPFTIAGAIAALGVFFHALLYFRIKLSSWTCGLQEKILSKKCILTLTPMTHDPSQTHPRPQSAPTKRKSNVEADLDMTLPSIPSTTTVETATTISIPTSTSTSAPQKEAEVTAEPSQEKWSLERIFTCFRSQCDRRTVILTLLSCAVIGPYRGMELTTMQFLPTFSVFSDVHLSEAQGTRVLFSMNTAYATGRFLGILLGLKFRPELILVGNFVLVLISNVILLVAGQSVENYLWVGSICLGAGLSTIFPSYYSYIEKFFFVSHSVVSVITVSDGILASIYPLVVGHSVERTPAVLTWVNFFSMSVMFLAFGITYYMTKIRRI